MCTWFGPFLSCFVVYFFFLFLQVQFAPMSTSLTSEQSYGCVLANDTTQGYKGEWNAWSLNALIKYTQQTEMTHPRPDYMQIKWYIPCVNNHEFLTADMTFYLRLVEPWIFRLWILMPVGKKGITWLYHNYINIFVEPKELLVDINRLIQINSRDLTCWNTNITTLEIQ